MSTQTMTYADSVLKDVYAGPVIEQLNYKTYMIDMIERETQFQMDARGRKAIVPVHAGRNRGRGARAEGGVLPVAGRQTWDDAQIRINYFYQGIELTDASIEASKSNDGAFVNLLDAEVKGATADMKKDVQRQIWGPGNGMLTGIRASATTQSTLPVDSLQYIHVGDPVDVLRKTDGSTSLTGSGRTVVALSTTGPTVTLDSTAGGTVDTAWGIYLAGSRGQEMKSMQEIVAANRELFGINSATAGLEFWNGQVLDVGASAAAPALAGENAFEKIADKVGATGQGETQVYISNRGVRRNLADSFQSTKRFTNREAVQIHGGYSGIMIASGNGEVPLVIDDDAPFAEAYAIDRDALRWYQQTTPGFLEDPKSGQILHLKDGSSAGTKEATWQGWLRWYASLASVAPNRLGKLRYCADDTPGITA